MKRVWIFLKKWWWVFILGIAVVLFFALRINTQDDDGEELDNFVNKVRKNIDKVNDEADIEKAKIKAKADADREELERIKAMDDEKERRKRLAELLTRLDAES